MPKWTHLPIGNSVVVDSHLRVHMLQVPAEAPAFELLPQGYPLRHVPKIHPWVLCGTDEKTHIYQPHRHSWNGKGQSLLWTDRTGPIGWEEQTRGGNTEGERYSFFPSRKPLCQSSGALIVLSLGVIQRSANSNQLFNYECSRPCWLRERERGSSDWCGEYVITAMLQWARLPWHETPHLETLYFNTLCKHSQSNSWISTICKLHR